MNRIKFRHFGIIGVIWGMLLFLGVSTNAVAQPPIPEVVAGLLGVYRAPAYYDDRPYYYYRGRYFITVGIGVTDTTTIEVTDTIAGITIEEDIMSIMGITEVIGIVETTGTIETTETTDKVNPCS